MIKDAVILWKVYSIFSVSDTHVKQSFVLEGLASVSWNKLFRASWSFSASCLYTITRNFMLKNVTICQKRIQPRDKQMDILFQRKIICLILSFGC